MRTVSEDGTYVDYTTPKFGLRVRGKSCRTLALTGGQWEEYGNEFRLPLTAAMIDGSDPECENYDLSMNLADYETHPAGDLYEDRTELRAVLLGIQPLRILTAAVPVPTPDTPS